MRHVPFKNLTLSFIIGLAATMPAAAQTNSGAIHPLKVSAHHRYLEDAQTGEPIFILADTAWNLNALKYDEIDTYLDSRAAHGFNVVMFALNFFTASA